jgi:hypothetical protein
VSASSANENLQSPDILEAVGPGIGGLIIAGRERFDMDLVTPGTSAAASSGWRHGDWWISGR